MWLESGVWESSALLKAPTPIWAKWLFTHIPVLKTEESAALWSSCEEQLSGVPLGNFTSPLCPKSCSIYCLFVFHHGCWLCFSQSRFQPGISSSESLLFYFSFSLLYRLENILKARVTREVNFHCQCNYE